MPDLEVESSSSWNTSVFSGKYVQTMNVTITGAPNGKIYSLAAEKHEDPATKKVEYRVAEVTNIRRQMGGAITDISTDTARISEPKKDGPFIILSAEQFEAIKKGGNETKQIAARIQAMSGVVGEKPVYEDVKPWPLEKLWEERYKKAREAQPEQKQPEEKAAPAEKQGAQALSPAMQAALAQAEAAQDFASARPPIGVPSKILARNNNQYQP